MKVAEVMGVFKAYTTRVGSGPFPTEFKDEFSDHIRELGAEYGATTGRPRRCGWFDAVIAQYSTRINGFTSLAVTKLDVLDTLAEIKICTGYWYKGKTIRDFPAEIWIQNEAEPVYETHPGWMKPLGNAHTFSDLPTHAQNYLNRISELTGVPIHIVSVGSERKQTIFMD